MIYFLTKDSNRHPIYTYLAYWGWESFSFIQPLSYEKILGQPHFGSGVYIFSDIEVLSDPERLSATALWEQLQLVGSEIVTVNHPTRSLRRYALLTSLYAAGSNHFTVHRLSDDCSSIRLPAFLRRENDHKGSQTDILEKESELSSAVLELERAGMDLSQWIATEFCDTRDEHGVYRKYSCFLVNDVVIPRHVFFSKDWMQKFSELTEDCFIEEELKFFNENPHQQQVRKIFRDAQIEYGRIDYGFLDGKIQVWEINTNPMIISFQNTVDLKRLSAHHAFHSAFIAEFEKLNATVPLPKTTHYSKRIETRCRVFYQRHGKPFQDFARRIRRLRKRL